MLWTDVSSRRFIAEYYPWFLDTFDMYVYPIQRADAIRYFVLHHYGGVYMDLDVGCRRPMDRLLVYPVVLAKTIPVGVSNDLMFSERGHPFMNQLIHSLIAFDYNWVLNYPTVMFSTGPMFVSAQYGAWASAHPPTPGTPGSDIRILPKSLYGKNIDPLDAPNAFFSHFYGSSWHADDAAFIGFLGKWGKGLMWVGLAVLIVGGVRLFVSKGSRHRDRYGRFDRYELILPRSYLRNGRVDLGLFTFRRSPSSPSSPDSSSLSTPTDEDAPILPIALDVRAQSPSESESEPCGDVLMPSRPSQGAFSAMLRAGNSVLAQLSGRRPRTRSHTRSRSRGSRGVLFLPAIFPPPSSQPDFERRPTEVIPVPVRPRPEKAPFLDEPLDECDAFGASSSRRPSPARAGSSLRPSASMPNTRPPSAAEPSSPAPPPYQPPLNRDPSTPWIGGNWPDWESR